MVARPERVMHHLQLFLPTSNTLGSTGPGCSSGIFAAACRVVLEAVLCTDKALGRGVRTILAT